MKILYIIQLRDIEHDGHSGIVLAAYQTYCASSQCKLITNCMFKHLHIQAGMPYLWGIGVVVPFVWTQLDGIAARLRAGEKLLAAWLHFSSQ